MTTLEKIKQALRTSHSKLDDDIQADIDACLADLQLVGVKYKGEEDPLIFNAIKLWCRSLYTDDPAKGAVFSAIKYKVPPVRPAKASMPSSFQVSAHKRLCEINKIQK